MSGKGTEEALWGGEEMFRSLVQSSCDVITILDTDGAIIHDGPAVERVLGYKPEERIDTSIFDEAHPDNLERGTRAFGKVLAAPGAHLALELPWPHKNGSLPCCPTIFSRPPGRWALSYPSRDGS
jgi:PAS domain S-box-containing protein